MRSAAEQISRFSPGTLLWRTARSSGKDVAFVGPRENITYAELADHLLDAGASTAGQRSATCCVGDCIDIETVLAGCRAFARASVVVCDMNKGPEGMASKGRVDEIPVHGLRNPGAALGWTIDAPDFADVAQVRYLSRDDGLAWSSEALSIAWGLCSPPAGSTGVMTSPLCSASNWSALFGVLLGRGRIVVPGTCASLDWLESLASEHVQELNLSRTQLQAVLELPQQTVASVRSVRVWHTGSVPSPALLELKRFFPAAAISRVLEWSGGPISLATVEQLEEFGDSFIGRPVLGVRATVAEDGQLLVAESPCLPRHVFARTGWTSPGETCHHTGLRVARHTSVHRTNQLFIEAER